ncbi:MULTISPECIES: carbohydrate ABC transporter permease [Ruminococcus]|uniref:Oligogalacturonide ABC transporter membrane protein n=1 Tax=Ruminococcus flavefaciens TaxID=1265 RepID=A0A1M7HY85_RUMFL|nr:MULTISPECIES: carbohydrate ABC transporter permease [Ruminococcus]MCR4796116.1 carbohydrate ABC transporter permease [Ruminococcus sp.]SHM33420.1 oligogalacturonide ABC transporter membrane protein [Ruminococcus flavefaciens]
MRKLLLYFVLGAVGIVMLYPMLWLVGASFKSNDEIFTTIWFMPKSFDTHVYKNAWDTVTPYTMGHYFINTFLIIIPKTVFAVLSSVIVAYGFARFDFPLKKFFSALLICGMLMPSIVTVLPLYRMWSCLGLLDTYIPLTLPSLFACEGMFVFILIQFLKRVPKEFDEAARMDGCGTLRTLFLVLIPCIRPAVISIAVFTFLWTMNDFLSPLIMIQSVEKYPLSLALRLSVDSTGQGYEQRKIIAMSVIGLIPSVAVFALAQKKFISGITAGGLSE